MRVDRRKGEWDTMKERLTALIVVLALLTGSVALADVYWIKASNASNFGQLIVELLIAYERPEEGDVQKVNAILEAIRAEREADYEVASSIASHWYSVYVDPNGEYRTYLYRGGERADELAESAIPDSEAHAFVVLGYELKDGEMTPELIGRCEAAAAAARTYPHAILVCSGGATGPNNPKGHTEAGMMRDYLVEKCGIDPSRIYIDERAMSTLENAVNTLEILMREGVRTMTIVTSSYHQRWGQVLYNAMAAFYRQAFGYEVEIVGNYSYEIEPDERFRQDDRIAMRQLSAMLKLPKEVTEDMKAAF